jgi:hypothetical protein
MRCNIPSLLSAIPSRGLSYLWKGPRVRILKLPLPLMDRAARIFLSFSQFLWHERRKEKTSHSFRLKKEKNLRLTPHGQMALPVVMGARS